MMDPGKALTLPPETAVRAAAEAMSDRGTGAAMVVDGERLIGIFTERDALFRVIARGLDPASTPVSMVMTHNPQTVGPKDSFGYALVLMQEGGYRHAPVVENDKPIGIVSSRSAMDPDLEEFVSEANRRKHMRMGN
jgi:CBS domain-containing protein